jgi:hypothetical protein
MENQTCCFTGHRNIPKDEYSAVKKHLEEELKKLIHQGVKYFGAGGRRSAWLRHYSGNNRFRTKAMLYRHQNSS